MDSGTAIRDGHESYVRRIQELSSPEPGAKSAVQRSTPGILIFSRRQQLLHTNRRALELMGHFDETEIGPATDIPLASVQELRIVIQKTLDQRKEANISESFELESATFDVGRKVLIRGFGIANRNSHDDSRIVFVLDSVGHQEDHKAQQAPAVFPSKSRGAVS
jgi:hypothetical protein